MDLGFVRLDPANARPAPVPPDYRRLVDGLLAMQAESRTAETEARFAAGAFDGVPPLVALVEVLLGGPDWLEAVAALEGAFHPHLAKSDGFPP